ncbi:hypothetical protein U1Q18_030850, partial [Sarracenia purpurea var. burkii]
WKDPDSVPKKSGTVTRVWLDDGYAEEDESVWWLDDGYAEEEQEHLENDGPIMEKKPIESSDDDCGEDVDRRG